MFKEKTKYESFFVLYCKIIKFWQQKAIQPVLYFHLSFILY